MPWTVITKFTILVIYLNANAYCTVKLGIGGFSNGAATALHSATCHVLGRYGNGNVYPINLSVIISLSGWLPCSRFDFYFLPFFYETHPLIFSFSLSYILYA
jgi:hypothetical protein